MNKDTTLGKCLTVVLSEGRWPKQKRRGPRPTGMYHGTDLAGRARDIAGIPDITLWSRCREGIPDSCRCAGPLAQRLQAIRILNATEMPSL